MRFNIIRPKRKQTATKKMYVYEGKKLSQENKQTSERLSIERRKREKPTTISSVK
jgi:hypothetical protein